MIAYDETRLETNRRRPPQYHEDNVGPRPIYEHLDAVLKQVCQSRGHITSGWGAYPSWCGTRWLAYGWTMDRAGEYHALGHAGLVVELDSLDRAIAGLIGSIWGMEP